MRGFDTNVVIRLLTGDDPARQRQVKQYIKNHCSVESPGFINRLVLLETVWVLQSAYGYDREQISRALEGLLRTSELAVENSGVAWAALRAYRAGADFADALVGAANEESGCDVTLTFDAGAAKRLNQFELVGKA